MNFNKYKSLFFTLILFFGIYISLSTNVMADDLTSMTTNLKKTILIDPGHGGYDAGASSKSGVSEKGINLNIGLKLKDKLNKMNFNAVMTREDDRAFNNKSDRSRSQKAQDLAERCKMKIDTNCDLFLSIHLNTFPEEIYSGAQVWYSKNDQSKLLAQIAQGNLKTDLNNNNNRVQKPALNQYRILRGDTMPSIIVECGFLSNAAEAELLSSDTYQDKVAASLAKSIKEYFDKAKIS